MLKVLRQGARTDSEGVTDGEPGESVGQQLKNLFLPGLLDPSGPS